LGNYRRVIDVLIVIFLILLAGYGAYGWWTAQEHEDWHQCVLARDKMSAEDIKECMESRKFWREHPGGGSWLKVDGKWIKQPGSSGN
jgi:hypothetical protein